MNCNTLKDIIKNECIHRKLEVVPIKHNMRENRLSSFGHVQRTPIDVLIRRNDKIVVNGATKTEAGLNEHGLKL